MEYVPVNLANGVLPDTLGTLCTIPTGSSAMVRSTLLVNKTAGEVTVVLKIAIGVGGTALNIIPPSMKLRPYSKYDDNSVINLPAGSVISASCNTANAVDFIISGVIAT